MADASPRLWTASDARRDVSVPGDDDDKYTRGVLGVVTGSERYPGAAVLGVDAAVRTGVGMVRYVGGRRAEDAVLARRPEVVVGRGRVQAWLIGSGQSADDRDVHTARALVEALADDVPTVIDAGALDLVPVGRAGVVVTPHVRELVRLLAHHGVRAEAGAVAAEPETWSRRAAETLGVVVLLKGARTHVAEPGGGMRVVASDVPWLATAGTGDVLAGVLGALVATRSDSARDPAVLADLAATAAYLHGRSAALVSRGGPLAALDVAEGMPAAVRELLGD